jgi:hypothetical protein
MNAISCCPTTQLQHPILNAIFAILTVALALLSCPTNTRGEDLVQAYIRSPQANVHCGPGTDFYTTEQLKKGQRVEIIEQRIDGWVAIVPPATSFCWLPARDCKLHAGGKEVEITAEKAVCWIGSSLKQTEYRWQSELPRGTQLTILGEAQRTNEDGSVQLWYRIAPPADEVRWIRIEHLGTIEEVEAASPVVTASATQGITTQNKKPKEKSLLTNNSDKPDRKITLATAYQPSAAPVPPQGTQPPRRLKPSRSDAELNPIQPANSNRVREGAVTASHSDYPPGVQVPFRPDSYQATLYPSESNYPMARPTPQPSNPNWDQFQAFPTNGSPGYVAGPNMPASNRYASTSISPLEWFFSDFVHRNGGNEAPASMAPIPDPQIANAANYGSQPLAERNYSPEQPFQSRIAQLPRPRRRDSMGSPDSYAAPNSPSNMLALGAPTSSPMPRPNDPWVNNSQPSPANSNVSPFSATADYRNDGSPQYATPTSWHGISPVGSPSASPPLNENSADAYAPVNISSRELQEIQLSLSAEVAKPIEQWNLANYKAAIEERLNQSNDSLYRGEARLLIDRIEAFIQLKNRSASGVSVAPARPALGPLMPTNSETPATWLNATQYDASGWLVPVHATHAGQPEYALTDDRGNTITYVTAQPGVNLRRYLRQPVGLKGRRGFLTELSANHIVAERVVTLQR